MRSSVKNITLADLDEATNALLNKIAQANFHPDVAVYLETGARLLAASYHRQTGTTVFPLVIQRPGKAAKNKIAGLLGFLPASIKNFLRSCESRFLSKIPNPRKITRAPAIDLYGKKVLILDDAADSGESLLLAKKWAEKNGAVSAEIKSASLSATRPEAQASVDFWLYGQICRFPWSSDSPERTAYLKAYEQSDPSKIPTRSL